MSDIRNKYHIAIDSVGYILRGTPETPAYNRSVVPSQVNRLAISDLAYSDFAGTGLFYLAQTDWSSGIKTESIWKDDGKFYYSTNIDAFSREGEITVATDLALDNTFAKAINCGSVAIVNGATASYIGIAKNTNISIYKWTGLSWGEIAGTAISTSQNIPSYVKGFENLLWVGTVGNGNLGVINSYNGSTWTDYTGAIITATAWGSSALSASRAIEDIGGTIYMGIESGLNNECGIIATSDKGSTWTLVKDFGYQAEVIAMCNYNSKLYYLLATYPKLSLRVYDPTTSVDIEVESFNNPNVNLDSVSDKLLKVFGGKIVISMSDIIYEYDGNSIIEIFHRDSKKESIGYQADYQIIMGCVERNRRLYWANLVYDGKYFFNYKKPLGDSTTDYLYPLFADSSENLFYMTRIGIDVNLYKDSGYKTTISKNFLVFNEMSPVVSIDKLLYSITVIFEAMNPNDEIKIEYSIDNMNTWVSVADLTYASEQTNVKREIVIPNSILFNKIWWKVSMANSVGGSPTLLDLIMAYKPIPNYKNRWQMRLNFSDGIKLLNRQNDDRQGSDMNSQLWNQKLIKKQVKFQDIDYLEATLIAPMTKTQTSAKIKVVRKLPIQGRIRAVSGNVIEEMYYTSGGVDSILGITRGARGTIARAYISGQVLDNAYNVYVDDITTRLNFTDEDKTESIAEVLIIEA